MTNKKKIEELVKEIQELKARVQMLEARPVYVPYYPTQVNPYNPSPYWPNQYPRTSPIICTTTKVTKVEPQSQPTFQWTASGTIPPTSTSTSVQHRSTPVPAPSDGAPIKKSGC